MNLTTLGTIHTLISLVALASGLYLLVRDREINPRIRLGQVYVITTLLTALTGLGIFRHGGFGPPHVLSLLTIAALGVGWVSVNTKFYGRASRYFEVVAYTTTLLLFHMIPGFTETLTRLPAGAPIASSPDAAIFQPIYGTIFVVYLIVLGLQIQHLRKAPAIADDEVARQ